MQPPERKHFRRTCYIGYDRFLRNEKGVTYVSIVNFSILIFFSYASLHTKTVITIRRSQKNQF